MAEEEDPVMIKWNSKEQEEKEKLAREPNTCFTSQRPQGNMRRNKKSPMNSANLHSWFYQRGGLRVKLGG